jgi:hypothetical protein
LMAGPGTQSGEDADMDMGFNGDGGL